MRFRKNIFTRQINPPERAHKVQPFLIQDLINIKTIEYLLNAKNLSTAIFTAERFFALANRPESNVSLRPDNSRIVLALTKD